MIIDTHTHFYDPSRPEGVPWPREDNETLYRTVLPDEFAATAGPLGVTGTVVVEASPWLTDNDWILALAEKHNSIVGFVGNINLTEDASAQEIERLAGNRLFRGVRVNTKTLNRVSERAVARNLGLLADLDLALDVVVQPSELERLAGIARSLPALRLVIDHIAHVPIDGCAPDPEWVSGMERVASNTNVFCKVSRLTETAVTRPANPDPAYYAPTLSELFRIFSSERLMYGSNWPVCDLASDYATGLNIVQEYAQGLEQSETDDLFWRSAARAYKWVDRS
jgi:L-fuconolactonase